MKHIKVFAPASIANMGCGFDVIGMAMDAVGDVISMEIEDGIGIEIDNRSGVELPVELERNVMTPAVMALLAAYGKSMKVKIVVESKIRPGSGIGSSAASSAAAVFALNELLGRPFAPAKLVEFAMEGEKLTSSGVPHADNVAPALLGGVVLVRGYAPLDIVNLPVPAKFFCSLVHPDIIVNTRLAREIMPKEIPLRDAVVQWGNVGGLVAGLTFGDVELVGRSMRDAVAEPFRKRFIPGFDILKEKVISAGALALNISGSGPAVFALSSSNEIADKVANIMREHFAMMGKDSDAYVGSVSNFGARIM